jgi:hypothetical protein
MKTLQAVTIKETGKSKSANDNHAKADTPKKLTVVSPAPEKTNLKDVCEVISKDKGEIFNVIDPESDMVSYIEEYESKKAHEIDDIAVVVSRGRSLYQEHRAQFRRSENIIDGVKAKGKILEGMLLKIEKKLLRKSGKQWVVHYTQIYGQKSLRSAQDYMGLAEIDNILVYAPIGKERLLEIRRAIKLLGIDGDDPIGTFLKNFDIPFNPEDPKGDESIDDLKTGIDHAVAVTKIMVAEGKNGVPLDVNLDLVKRMTGLGIKVSNSLINDLFIIKKENQDVNHHLEGLCNLEGPDEDILSPIKKVERLPSLVAGIKVAVAEIDQNVNLADRINKDDVGELEEYARKLKGVIENKTDTK